MYERQPGAPLDAETQLELKILLNTKDSLKKSRNQPEPEVVIIPPTISEKADEEEAEEAAEERNEEIKV